jgi:arylsulfatase A-like enzyme
MRVGPEFRSPPPAIARTSDGKTASTAATQRGLRALDMVVLSAWCGLAGGLLEVSIRVACKVLPGHRMYMMSRHFVWMAPLSNLLLFTAIGFVLTLATKFWPRRGGWLFSRLVCALSILPVLGVTSPKIYPWAWSILAVGIASRLVPFLERRQSEVRRWLMLSFPALLGVVVVLAGFLLGGDWLKARREASRPLPPGDPPNVLMIVLDTVRADRLSLYGYRRPTSPTLEALARRGIRFDQACATAPWTLPSHASMFTGRWPHELGLTWYTPLGSSFPTLAQYLGSRGYATADFVANFLYCSAEFGLDRGFTHCEDYVLEPMSPLRMCYLGDLGLRAVSHVGWRLSSILGAGSFLPPKESSFWRFLANDPKIDAGLINREFLDWLSKRREPARPFFAFLNYLDAHSVYLLPPGTPYRFGRPPKTDAEVQVLVDWFHLDKLRLPQPYLNLARDCYDSCLGYLDQQLGELFGELKRRGVLDRTLVIVTADHGEGLGEHNLFFHGESLYRTEIHVPLVIAMPGQTQSAVVSGPVSLRDLPATIVDLTGQGTGAPFSGRSLTRMWRDSRPADPSGAGEGAISELADPNPNDPNQGRSPARKGALISIAEGDYIYIRNEGDGSEELFNWREDPTQADNRARSKPMQAVKERLRTKLNQMVAGQGLAP